MKESDIRNKDSFSQYRRQVEEDILKYFKKTSGFKAAPCISCGSKNFREQFKKTGFTYVLCDDCGSLYVNLRPSLKELLVFNSKAKSSSFWVNKFFLPVAQARREKIFQPRARVLADRLRNSKRVVLADIGAGFALFLEEIRKILPNAELIAIEPSVEMAKICRGKGFLTINKTVEGLKGMQGKFDCLTAFELLEHLYDPQILFKKAYGLLRKGGILFLTTLNCEGFDIQLLWENSDNIYPPQHINFFNPGSLRHALERNGFFVEELATPGNLDWDIVENRIKDRFLGLDSFWVNFSKRASKKTKDEFQQFLSRNLLSSHMMALARKK